MTCHSKYKNNQQRRQQQQNNNGLIFVSQKYTRQVPRTKPHQLCIYPQGGVYPHNNIKQQTAGLRAAERSWGFSLISVMSVYFAWRCRGASRLKGRLSAGKQTLQPLGEKRREEERRGGTEATRSWVEETRGSQIERQKTTRIRDGGGRAGNENEVSGKGGMKLEGCRNSFTF